MRQKISILMIVFAALAVAGVSVAYAGTPSDPQIHGCYKTSNPGQGVLIVIFPPATCPSGYTALNWPAHSLTPANAVTAQYIIPPDGAYHQYDLGCDAGAAMALSADGQVSIGDGTSQNVISVLTIRREGTTVYRFMLYGDAPGGSDRTLDADVVCANYS